MLADEYRQVSDISFMELEKIRKKMKNSLLVGGWAAYYLSNSRFKEWKKTDYMGSKDIDFGIRAEDLGSTARKLKNLGYTPVNFRFYKIFDSFFVLNFSDFNLKFFQELREIYKLRNKENIAKIANSAQVSMELSGLRLDGDEIRNIKTSFL